MLMLCERNDLLYSATVYAGYGIVLLIDNYVETIALKGYSLLKE